MRRLRSFEVDVSALPGIGIGEFITGGLSGGIFQFRFTDIDPLQGSAIGQVIALRTIKEVEHPHPQLLIGNITGVFFPTARAVDIVFQRLIVENSVDTLQFVDLFTIAAETDRIEPTQRIGKYEIIIGPGLKVGQHVALPPGHCLARSVLDPYIVIGRLSVELTPNRAKRNIHRIDVAGGHRQQ